LLVHKLHSVTLQDANNECRPDAIVFHRFVELTQFLCVKKARENGERTYLFQSFDKAVHSPLNSTDNRELRTQVSDTSKPHHGVRCFVLTPWSASLQSPAIAIAIAKTVLFWSCYFLWSPYAIGQTIIFLPCGFFFFFLSFLPRLISAVADWMSAIFPHMVWP